MIDKPQDNTGAHRQQVRDLIQDFARGFNEKGLYLAKLERYVDALESLPIEQLRAALDGLRGGASLPPPDKIREAAEGAILREMFRREAAERAETLRRLADPKTRAQLRSERAERSGGLVGERSIKNAFHFFNKSKLFTR